MEKKRNWEIQYEKYKDSETQARLDELKDKFESKTITREENDEYQGMKKIMENLPKVDNVKEYMDKLESDLAILKEEYEARKQGEQNEIDLANLDKEIDANLKRQDEIIAKKKENKKKIEQSKDSDEIERLQKENDDIDEELANLKFQAGENNKKFAKLHDSDSQNQAGAQMSTKRYLARFTNEDLRVKCFEISTMLSKCNMVASNLMKGLSIDSIQVKLEGWKDRKFTSKDPLPLTRKEKVAKQQGQSSTKGATNKVDPIGVIHGTSPQTTQVQSQVPAKTSEFAKEFPRLAKRFPNMGENFLGKALLAAKKHLPKRKEKTNVDPNATTVLNKQSNGNSIQQSQQEKKEMFRNYVKYDVLEVADKGLEEAKKEYEEGLKNKLKEQQSKAEEKGKER